MWLFAKWRERARVRATFSKYISIEQLDQIMKGPTATRSMLPKQASICFVLLQVRDDPLDQALVHLSTALDTVVECGGMSDQMGSCVLAIFGHPISADPDKNRTQRDMCVSRLLTDMGQSVRMIYGDKDGLVGNIGSPKRLHYGFLIANFHHCLAVLIALEFGKAARI
jgi:hypothetical protein